jgi:hypothetical protein
MEAQQRWLKHKVDGTIYGWDKYLAENELCEEVSPEIAFPERHIPKKQAKRKAKMDLTTEKIPEKPDIVNVELNTEASKGLLK